MLAYRSTCILVSDDAASTAAIEPHDRMSGMEALTERLVLKATAKPAEVCVIM